MKFLFPPILAVILLFSCASADRVIRPEADGIMPEEQAETRGLLEEEEPPPSEPETGEWTERAVPETENSLSEGSPMTRKQIETYIAESARRGFQPVLKDGGLYGAVYDLYGNGLQDYFILFAEAGELGTDFASLSDISRIYNPNVVPLAFYIQGFLQEPSRMVPGKRVDLGKRVVAGELTSLPLSKYGRLPFALIIDFINAEKVEQEWIIYGSRGITRFTIVETPSVGTIIRDLDDDGLIDIILRESALEEGVGSETFLTWYRWNGKIMDEYRTTNIVQNIQKFIKTCSSTMANREWNTFLRHALPWDTLRTLEAEGLSRSVILDRIFTAAPGEYGTAPPVSALDSIDYAVFPQITENPFIPAGDSFEFPLTVRIVTGGTDYLYTAVIVLNRNPFQQPQFYFALHQTPNPSDRR